jgi:Tfp pilus assembly protein PilF
MKFKYQILASSVFVVALSISATVLARPQSSVGEVQFENSGNAAAQAPFLRGLALLHNFEYDSAEDAFRDAQAADPAFAMAYWGEAMTHNHPLWMEQDRDAAREALYRLGEDQESRLTKTNNQRERAYLGAIESLYGEGEKRLRDFAYADAMAALHEKYPDDVNATAFTALSILGTAHDGRDFAIYMRSAALLEEIFPENRTHPGVLHYLIHSYDDPIHAPLGLRAARRYGKVAPNAAHALHMTSHIFVAMGMWDDVVTANEQAVQVVNRQRATKGEAARQCGHYNEWLVYGFLQRGEIDRADSQIAACRNEAQDELDNSPTETALELYRSRVLSYSDVALRRAIDVGGWADDAPIALPEGRYLNARWMRSYGEMITGRGDLEKMREALTRLSVLADAIAAGEESLPDGEPTFEAHREVALRQASGLEKLADGNQKSGIDDLRMAAKMESALPIEFGPPAIAKPSYELLGEELEQLGMSDEARQAYEKALALTPNRRLVNEGLKRLLAN